MNAMTPQPPLAPADWNFDSIPDHHLIACCYWEYARESAFLREFKSRCVEVNHNPKPLDEAFELCGKDAQRVLSIGSVANSFLLGFGFPPNSQPSTPDSPSSSEPPISGSFPAPWQSLSQTERDYRAHLAVGPVPPDAPPFQRAAGPEAVNALLFLAGSVVSSLAPLPAPLAQQTLQDQLGLLNSCATPNPQSSPAAPVNAHPPLTVLRLDTHSQPADEIALFQIQWGSYSDDQIVEAFRAWVKVNRPANIRPAATRGHKLKDWRAHLTRLAVMRLLARFSALQLLDSKAAHLPAVWETKQFSGSTWLEPVKWHDARREARQVFHQLFPFLPLAQDPLSWPTAPVPARLPRSADFGPTSRQLPSKSPPFGGLQALLMMVA